MRQGFVIGLGSGLVSAVLFFSAARGGPWLGLLLFLLTPLPPLLAGLGWGWLPAAAGALAGSAAMAVVASMALGLGYFLVVGLPAAVIAYLAYLSRPSNDAPDGREWYPAGRLLAAMSLYAGALPVLALPSTGGSFDSLRPLAAEMVRAAFKQSGDMRLQAPTDEQVGAIADLIIAVAPGALAVYWLLIMTPNLYLAGRIVGASGHLARNWPDLPALAYPPGYPLLVVLALAATFAPGIVGVAGASFSGALLVAYLIAGLALMHFIARGRAPWILWFVYAGLVLFTPYAAVALMAIGLLEPALRLRRRFGASPPSV